MKEKKKATSKDNSLSKILKALTTKLNAPGNSITWDMLKRSHHRVRQVEQ
jgi:hypothetical protein